MYPIIIGMNTEPPEVVRCGAISHLPEPKSNSQSETVVYFGDARICSRRANFSLASQSSLLNPELAEHCSTFSNTPTSCELSQANSVSALALMIDNFKVRVLFILGDSMHQIHILLYFSPP